MRIVKLFLSIVILLVAASCGPSDANNVNAEELKTMMSENPRLLVVDTRTEYEYKLGRIPKTINISQEKFYMLETLLPKEKDTPIVFYCGGVGWMPSVQAAFVAKKLGYTNTMVFPGGYPEWSRKGYEIER